MKLLRIYPLKLWLTGEGTKLSSEMCILQVQMGARGCWQQVAGLEWV